MTRRKPIPMTWVPFVDGDAVEWRLLRLGRVVATITSTGDEESPRFEAVYLVEHRPFVRLQQAKTWLRDRVKAAIKRWGSVDLAEAEFERVLNGILRRRLLARDTGDFDPPVASIRRKGGGK